MAAPSEQPPAGVETLALDAPVADDLEPEPPGLPLQIGPLTTEFRHGRIGRIFCDGHEVWHGVAFLLRDEHWRTPPWIWADVQLQPRADGWRLDARGHLMLNARVDVHLQIDGRADGSLQFTGIATPQGDIRVNRLGLCLLHPHTLGGRELLVTHDDGRTSRSTFPQRVPAWPPFTGVQGVDHAFGDDGWAEAALQGDVFEMEDQRNNADASFKTYSRSNFMPRPCALAAGQTVRHTALLRIARRSSRAAALQPAEAADKAPQPWQGSLGFEISAADLAAYDSRSDIAHALRPGHLHLCLDARGPSFDAQALRRHLLACGADLRIDVDLRACPEAQARTVLANTAMALHDAGLEPRWVAIYPTTAGHVQAARALFPCAAIGGGTPDYFVQLNRAEHLPAVDFLGFSVCPIVHDASDDNLMHGVHSLPAMLDTLRARHPGTPLHVGPLSIEVRRSPLGEPAHSDGRQRLPLATRDARCGTQFGAEWLERWVRALQQHGVPLITAGSLSGAHALARVDVDGVWQGTPAATRLRGLWHATRQPSS